tara:strand:- start:2007 stop:2258 length:252 start_codon:yes stop_codon:yes gene_type:complete
MSDDYIDEKDIIDDDGWKEDKAEYDFQKYRKGVIEKRLDQYRTSPKDVIGWVVEETIFQMDARIADLEAQVSGMRELDNEEEG